jgi:serine-type D-Ala-D-Ala carboxypeptidase (penicillin-binding protein 5/6)
MKKTLLVIAILGGVFFLLPNSISFKKEVHQYVNEFLGKKSRFEEITYKEGIDKPWLIESRSKATVYQPLPISGIGVYAVPTAHAAIILDAGSGNILYEQQAHQKRQIASLTKIFTALLVAEHVKNFDEPVTITEEALYVDGTKVGCPNSGVCPGNRLVDGEKLRVKDLLKAALMNSANDAVTALGIHVSGSAETFVELMNTRAKELGLNDSHFCTPSGLEIDGREQECYSSAHDIARITVEALKYPVLWDIMRIQSETIFSVDGQYSHDVANTNRLLGQMPYLLGTKTGFTPLAGYSLLAATSDSSGERQVVAVVLDDQERWGSIQSMFEWTFSTHQWK